MVSIGKCSSFIGDRKRALTVDMDYLFLTRWLLFKDDFRSLRGTAPRVHRLGVIFASLSNI